MASRATRTISATTSRVRKGCALRTHRWARAAPVLEGQVLYESFSGNGVLDNPEAIFQSFAGRPTCSTSRTSGS
jgi:hypothetical protein